MAQWNQISNKFQDSIKFLYDQKFPMIVRQSFADFLEILFLQNKPKAPEDIRQYSDEVENFYNEILQKIRHKATYDEIHRNQLIEAAWYFTENYSSHKEKLYEEVKFIFSKEKLLIERNNSEILGIYKTIKDWILTVDQVPVNLYYLQDLHNMIFTFNQIICNVGSYQQNIVKTYLEHWAYNEPNDMIFLDIIQEWFEYFASILFNILEKMLGVDQSIMASYENQKAIEFNYEIIRQNLISLVQNALVIVNHPQRIIKTKSNIKPTTVRFLLGSLFSGDDNNLPAMTVDLLSEDQVESVQKGTWFDQGKGTFDKNSVRIRYKHEHGTKSLIAHFERIKLMSVVNSNDRERYQHKHDEKFALIFHFHLNKTIHHFEFKQYVYFLIHPVVTIVHGNQELETAFNIFWHDATRKSESTDKATWRLLAPALSNIFENMTGRGLTPDNLYHLGNKLFNKKNQLKFRLTDDLKVSWTEFRNDSLGNKKFSFWTWFYECLKLTNECLSKPWNDGSIIGFINKETAEKMFDNMPSGTFLLRFSDSVLGGISISWKRKIGDIIHVDPFTNKILSTKSFSNRIMELDSLIFLHPDIPKEYAFKQYATEIVVNHGYTGLKTTIAAEDPKFEEIIEFLSQSPDIEMGRESKNMDQQNF